MNMNAKTNKIGWSFEVFPPKRTANISSIYTALADLKRLNPDFISVTYGAGGSENCQATCEIADAVQNHYEVDAMAHLPAIGLTKCDVNEQLQRFKNIGVKKILALRGDKPIDGRVLPEGDFSHASDLAAFIKSSDEFSTFEVWGACYPELHKESPSPESDIRMLKHKVDSGVEGLISQLFFSNDVFYRFLDRAACAGIGIPIEAGIMPVTNKKQIERMSELCGAAIPEKLRAVLDRFSDDPEAMLEIGCAFAIDQIIDLAAHGVSGIHLYTMNKPEIAQRIYQGVKHVLGR